jgi:hypothetical protein
MKKRKKERSPVIIFITDRTPARMMLHLIKVSNVYNNAA